MEAPFGFDSFSTHPVCTSILNRPGRPLLLDSCAMPGSPPPGTLGLDLRSKRARPCGLCGWFGQMSQAHVPPQTAGNSKAVSSSVVIISGGRRESGRPSKGGLWVRGLCKQCNSDAGSRFDHAYGDFANRLRSSANVSVRLCLLDPWAPPPVSIAPGLVARSVLVGMFAISPQLRIIFPRLADDLRMNKPHIRMPDGADLRMALFPGKRARIAGPMSAHRVLTLREDFDTFGEIFFPPVARVLAPKRAANVDVPGLSALDRYGWVSINEWPMYGNDITGVDLRHLVRKLPVVPHPMWSGPDEWVELMADGITPILDGTLP